MNKTNAAFHKQRKNGFGAACLTLVLGLILTASVFAQTTDFTYQGRLTDTGTTSANYDFEFRLCDSSAADCSAPLDSNSRPGVAVSNGVFTVTLNFGASNFNGADRFLEIRVKRPGETNYTTLAPRQKITSAPYAIQSRNAENASLLSGFTINQLVLDSDTRLNPSNYIQNTTTAQPSANFNIGGSGTANIFNATTQFNLGGSRILGNAGTGNLFAGSNAGVDNTGGNNSFFGSGSGTSNAGSNNSSFGSSAGRGTTSGAGGNSFFGSFAGNYNGSGAGNTFIGANANTNQIFSSGDNNTLLGANTLVNAGLNNAAAIGYRAQVTQNNSLVLGSISGVNGATANTNVGIGTTAPSARFQIADGGGNIFFSNSGCPTGFAAIAFVTPLTGCTNYALTGGNGSTYLNRQTGGTLFFRENNIDQMVIAPGGNVGIGTTAPGFKLHVFDASNTGLRVQTNAAGGTVASFGGKGAFQVDAGNVSGGRLNILENGNVGIGNVTPQTRLSINGSGAPSAALELINGGIKATGAGVNTNTWVFTVIRTPENTCLYKVILDNPYTNNDPNAILFVTLNGSDSDGNNFGGYSNYSPIVKYTTDDPFCNGRFNNRWTIYINGDDYTHPLRINVMVIKP